MSFALFNAANPHVRFVPIDVVNCDFFFIMEQNPTSKMALLRHIGIFTAALFTFAPIFGQVPNGSVYGIFRAGPEAGI
ncbi:MAG: hypothetical protein AAFQ87_28245, partial [Bacteroidota bacterium]